MSDAKLLDREALQALEAFRASHETRTLTILFTDLVNFTALKSKVGESRGLEIQSLHRRHIRSALGRYPESKEIGTTGDSFLLVFVRPSDAVAFALEVVGSHRGERDSAAADSPAIRIGIHMGEVALIDEGGGSNRVDLYGLQVDLAARVQALAGGDQILMTRGVFDNARARIRGRDLESVGSLRWVRHGFYRFKGSDDPFEICEVGEERSATFDAPESVEKARRVEDREEISGWRPGAGVNVPGANWVLEKRLGQGGFGEVWLAHDKDVESRKTVFKFCTKRNKVRSLRRELNVFNKLSERTGKTPPGIVEVRAAHDTEAPFYIELEFVDGCDLDAWIQHREGQSNLHEKLDLAVQMAESLAAVHDAGLVHRDIKPSNFLVERRQAAGGKPRVLLTDFGIGQVALEEALDKVRGSQVEVHTATLGQAAGTFLYIAPEVLHNSESPGHVAKKAAAPADVYSLGVTLYQLFGGDAGAVPGLQLRLVSDRLLRQDLHACLDDDPARRPSAAAVAQRLRDYGRRIQRRRRSLCLQWAAATALAVSLGFAAHLVWRTGPRGDSGSDASPAGISQSAGAAQQAGGPVGPSADRLATPLRPSETSMPPVEFVSLPGGAFIMGDPEESNASPERVVVLSPFEISAFEVTVGQYGAFVAATGHPVPANSRHLADVPWSAQLDHPERPVVNVSWSDANDFCDWLNEEGGAVHSLPTEAQWEYACRAGTREDFAFGKTLSPEHAVIAHARIPAFNADGGRLAIPLDPVLWTEAYRELVRPVGSHDPNSWGLHDMHGNVSEWCADWYAETLYRRMKNGATDPVNLDSPEQTFDHFAGSSQNLRVVRGGAWNADAHSAKSGVRHSLNPDRRTTTVGFRVVRTVR